MEDVGPGVLPPGSDPVGDVVAAWSGGAFDTVNNRLLVWGGGHGNSADNSVYAFSLGSLTWERAWGPTANAIITASDGIESSGYYATNSGGGTPDTTQPRSRHSHAHLVFASGKLWSVVAISTHPTASGARNLDAFDVSSDTWARIGDSGPPDVGYDGVCCADEVGNIWHYGSGGNDGFLHRYNISGNTWHEHGERYEDVDATNWLLPNAVYHPPTGRMYAIGQGLCVSWDLNPAAGTITSVDRSTTGPQNVVNAKAPGLAYHPASGKIIAWIGGQTVYALDPATHVWSALDMHPSNAVTPSAQQTNGTYGRFQWSAASNKFVLVNSASENVLLLEI